ncbi:MAG: hypothetical protein GXP27_21880 [Planctomycetes bacterium]|nr:hypothetical protein [Planctomycetota bacterium]
MPLLPMAILSRQASSTASGGPTDWVSMIEQRGGADRFTVDPESGLVVPGSDGLPEMTLQCCLSESTEPTNTCLIDVGSGLHTEELLRQVYSGVSQSDLSSWGGALPLHPHGAQFAAKRRFPRTLLSALRAIIGQPRLCLLYQQAPMSEAASPDSAPHSAASLRAYRVTCSRPVGLRILQVRRAPDRVQIVVQPTVVITPTAWVPQPGEATDIPANPYVYKIFLTQ